MNKINLETFVNISVNFPEINVVKYEYNTDLLIAEVVLSKEIDKEQEEKFIARFKECMQLLHMLKESNPQVFKIKFKKLAGLTFLRYYRDGKSLDDKEIDLLISLLREDFYDCLLNEEEIALTNDSYKKRMERDLLQQLNNKYNTGYLFVYRDHGRLCMFNRKAGGL